MLKRMVLLPDGNPTDLWAFSGITHYFTAALHRVSRRLGLATAVIPLFPQLNTEELLRAWATKAALGTEPLAVVPNTIDRLLDDTLNSKDDTTFAGRLEEYYECTAHHLQRLLKGRIRPGDCVLSMNIFHPYVGRSEFPISYYLDCSVIKFYLDPLFGTVPVAARAEPIRSALFQIEQESLRRAEHVFTFSSAAQSELFEGLVDCPRSEVIGAGINFKCFPSFSLRRRRRKTSLLFVGRDFDRKGGPCVLEAARLLDARKFAITCVTSSEDVHATEKCENVRIIRTVSKEKLRFLFDQAHILLAPTRNEPYGMAIAEAMAFSLPVVAPKIAAIPEILGPKNEGLLSTNPDGYQLARAISSLGVETSLYQRLALANYTRARLYFDWDRVALGIVQSALRHCLWA